MTAKPLNIIIAGGSLGGLIHAIVLARHGHTVTILERNATSSMAGLGAGLSCSEDMVNFMSEYDLNGLPYTIDTKDMRVINTRGVVVGSGPPGYKQRSTNWDTLYYRLRANFDGLKSSYCPAPPQNSRIGNTCYRDACTVSSVKYNESSNTVSVTYHDSGGASNTVEADVLIATDGPSSTIRQLLLPDVERTYVGYLGWRGTVHEKDLSPTAKAGLSEIPTLCPIENSCTIHYQIPGPSGSLEPGNRVYSWIWYRHIRFNSPEYTSLMTSALTGQVHRYTLPLGHLQAQYASKLKSEAGTLLAPCVGEMIQKTSQPFIQAITDLVTPQAVFCGGKVLLAGDALATLRPMSALGMNAAARSAVGLKEVVDGRKEVAEWERELLELAEWSRGVGEQRCGLFNLKKSAEEAEAAEFLKVDRL